MVQGNPRQLPRQSAYETVYQLPDTYQYADARQRNQGRDDIFVHESAARFAVISTESSSIRAPAAQEPTSDKKTAPAAPDRDSIAQPI